MLDVQMLSTYATNITCMFNDTSTQVAHFYGRKDTSSKFESLFDVLHSDAVCNVSKTLSSASIRCQCEDRNRVKCNILNGNSSNVNAQWQCGIVKHSIIVYSNVVDVSLNGTNKGVIDHGLSENTPFLSTTVRNGESTDYTKHEVLTHQKEINEQSTAYTNSKLMTTDTSLSSNNITKLNVTEIIIATAGPFILLDIALVLCIYRRKLRFCQKAGEHVISTVYTISVETGNHTAGRHNTAFGCVEFSSHPTAQNITHDAQSTRGPTGTLHVLDPYDDDPLYSFAKDTETKCTEVGACGYSGDTYREEPITDDIIDEDPMYTTVNTVTHFASVHKDIPFQRKQNNHYSHYTTVHDDGLHNTFVDNDDPLYSTVNKDSKPAMNKYDPHYSTVNTLGKRSATENFGHPCYADDKSHYASVNNEDDDDDPLYSTVNNDVPVHTSVNQENQGLTLIKEEPVCEPLKQTGPMDSSESKDDPIYSVVNKKKVRDMLLSDWNRAVPPAPLCTIIDASGYSKVNKKNKGKNTADAVNSLVSPIALPQDYPYSVVNTKTRDNIDARSSENRS